MNFRFQVALRQVALRHVAIRALLLGVCVSVALGSFTQVLLLSLSPTHILVANEVSPAHQSSLPEEAPPEAPVSNEPIKAGEVPSISPRRTSQRATGFCVQRPNLAGFSSGHLLPAKALLVGSQTPAPQFEHCYRNGCGAHLRR